MTGLKDKLEGRSLICIAETPLHLLGMICLLSDKEVGRPKRCDLLIRETVPVGDRGKLLLMKSGMFDSIDIVDSDAALACTCPGFLYNIELEPLLEKRKKRILQSCPMLEDREYDMLVIGTINTLARDIKRFFVRDGETVVIDDGKGSHDGTSFDYVLFLDDVVTSPVSDNRISKRCKRLLKKGLRRIAKAEQFFNVSCVFLFWYDGNEVEVFKNVFLGRLRPEVVSPEMWGFFFTDDQYESYLNARAIFLTLPSVEISLQSLEEEGRLIDSVVDCVDGSFVRTHYRRNDSGSEKYANRLISNEPFWEALVLSGAINSDNILLGCCSSAQIMPKILTGEEPTLVFLHKLIPALEEADAFEVFSDNARKMYSDKTKVIVPCTVEEFNHYLELFNQL